jgi:hypothetical protein
MAWISTSSSRSPQAGEAFVKEAPELPDFSHIPYTLFTTNSNLGDKLRASSAMVMQSFRNAAWLNLD